MAAVTIVIEDAGKALGLALCCGAAEEPTDIVGDARAHKRQGRIGGREIEPRPHPDPSADRHEVLGREPHLGRRARCRGKADRQERGVNGAKAECGWHAHGTGAMKAGEGRVGPPPHRDNHAPVISKTSVDHVPWETISRGGCRIVPAAPRICQNP